ncbi:hypothetical protein L3049_13485 [Labilibaculum sp. DW002]|uniref:Uncharacterized protein n=1 Tax=Paralabilibaculum antarcticum TaxID=2912572 RepID=A0ABT5VUL5_9BACT|nr:hypothetical protein [Labilibaculum sp. DW002]MDE5419012.1 hypothetical protein [Labilibaculum sp. DW002]
MKIILKIKKCFHQGNHLILKPVQNQENFEFEKLNYEPKKEFAHEKKYSTFVADFSRKALLVCLKNTGVAHPDSYREADHKIKIRV